MTHEHWHTDDFPEFRSSPPWVMEEMIAAGRGLATPILGDPSAARIAASVAEAAGRGAPLATVGCGTSEHGAMAVAEQLTAALGGRAVVHPRQAFEAMLDPWPGVCVAISHDGGTAATVAAMESARRAGAAVGLVTAVPGAAAAAAADRVLVTPVRDRSWCHTVGYLSPVLAGAAVADGLGTVSDPDAAERTISDAIDRRPAIRQVAGELHGVERYLTVGSGADRIAARELALKIEEGVRVPAAARDLETILHGHWVAVDERTAVVLLLTDARGGGRAPRGDADAHGGQGARGQDGRDRLARGGRGASGGRDLGGQRGRARGTGPSRADGVAARVGARAAAADARAGAPCRGEPRPHPAGRGSLPGGGADRGVELPAARLSSRRSRLRSTT